MRTGEFFVTGFRPARANASCELGGDWRTTAHVSTFNDQPTRGTLSTLGGRTSPEALSGVLAEGAAGFVPALAAAIVARACNPDDRRPVA